MGSRVDQGDLMSKPGKPCNPKELLGRVADKFVKKKFKPVDAIVIWNTEDGRTLWDSTTFESARRIGMTTLVNRALLEEAEQFDID